MPLLDNVLPRLRSLVHHATILGCQLGLVVAGAMYPMLSVGTVSGVPQCTTPETVYRLKVNFRGRAEALAAKANPDDIINSTLDDQADEA